MNDKPFTLEQYYINYLRNVRKVSESSINHYLGAIKTISRILRNNKKIESSVFEIIDVNELIDISDYLWNNEDFVELNTRGNRMYSAALNRYIEFARGEGFRNIDKTLLDIVVNIKKTNKKSIQTWQRSTIIRNQTMELANFLCEMNNNHKTFQQKGTDHRYMECHHIIPLNKQNEFENSLDVYANLICLCPTCHRFLHHGTNEERLKLLNEIYQKRSKRLEASGLSVTEEEFIKAIL